MPIFPLILHELFYSGSGEIVLGLLILVVPGAMLSAWAVRVSERRGGKALAVRTGVAAGVLAVGAAIFHGGRDGIMFLALIVGLAAMAGIVHRMAPQKTVEASVPEPRSRPFDPPRQQHLPPALIGGVVFAVATVLAFTALSNFIHPF